MLKPGIMLGDRYEIIELVGSGGMSEVYKAKDHKLNRHVAVKVLKNEFSDDRNFVSKFRVEAQSAAGLAHPNIVNVYDVGEDDGIYYIVMEYVEGITLKEYIYNKGRLSVEEALDFSLQIASGIEMAHQNHTIHRDIKPQNIIVSKSGTLKVTDFGIARAATSNTVASSAMGSVHYISPEQARGGYSDEKSDIYSLGITMYEMVTGHVPFEGDNNITVALMHIQGEMIPPRQYYPDIPAAFEKVILKCTQKKPERRYLTASALIADLHRVATNPNGDFVVLGENTSHNAPTVSMSQEELNTIRETTANKSLNSVSEQQYGYGQEAASQDAGGYDQTDSTQTSYYSADDQYNPTSGDSYDSDDYSEGPDEDFDPNDEDYQYDYDESNGVTDDRPIRSDRTEYDPEQYAYMNEEDEEIDPKLKKIVMIGGIVAAVLIAMVVMLILGRIGGWFKFSPSTTTENTSSTDDTQGKSIEMTLDVIGMKIEDAEAALKTANIPYTVDHENSDSIASGLVISQSYNKGDMIPEGASVRVVASSGKEEVAVPNVVGYEVSQAETLLAEAGLQVTHAYEYSDEVEKDHIITQEPGSTQTVSKDTKVKIVVSNGKEAKDADVPDLRGKTRAEAEAALTNAKLKLGNVTEEFSNDVEEGKVIAQSTSAGTKVPEGSGVDITISKGPEATTTEATTTEATTEAKKYSATFSGSITVSEGSENTYIVEVRYIVNGSTQVVTSGSVSATAPYSIPADTKLTGLGANNGQLQVTYNGSSTKPDDVQQSVNVQVAEE